MRPRIGITLSEKEIPSDQEYIDAVQQAGGEPIVLRPGVSENLASSLHGLILAGGGDVDPKFYHETQEPFCDLPEIKRDKLEMQLVHDFSKKQKPIFAICRGIQVLNVAFGGTLYQDLQRQLERELLPPHLDRHHLSREEKRKLSHPVSIESGSLLQTLLGSTAEVNSRHHQAIKDLAPGLKATAFSPDGIVEAVEAAGNSWILGVEWHPESVEVYPRFSSLFSAFVAECKDR